jgi:hypothetical protein
VNAYVIAVMTSLSCGLDVLCFRAIEPDSTGEHAQIYPSLDACIAARDRMTKAHTRLNWPCDAYLRTPPLPYDSKRFKVR